MGGERDPFHNPHILCMIYPLAPSCFGTTALESTQVGLHALLVDEAAAAAADGVIPSLKPPDGWLGATADGEAVS